jgi:hypothetical protein
MLPRPSHAETAQQLEYAVAIIATIRAARSIMKRQFGETRIDIEASRKLRWAFPIPMRAGSV